MKDVNAPSTLSVTPSLFIRLSYPSYSATTSDLSFHSSLPLEPCHIFTHFVYQFLLLGGLSDILPLLLVRFFLFYSYASSL